MQEPNVPTISPLEAKTKMDNGAALLDVREYPEWLESHVPGATLVPLGELKSDPQRGALAPEVLTLCRSGKRRSLFLREQRRGRRARERRDQCDPDEAPHGVTPRPASSCSVNRRRSCAPIGSITPVIRGLPMM